jgi:hypothetical protein
MKRSISTLLPVLLVLASQLAPAQSDAVGTKSISIQPVLWLDNLVPREFTGWSIQFEIAVSGAEALAARAVWFRAPVLDVAASDMNGYALSVEYRHYFSDNTVGWHLGPFAEFIIYEYAGYLKSYYGSAMRNLWDVGIVAGHKWQTGKLVFDISARTSWYSPSSYPKGGYFPRLRNSDLNSMMILTAGYSLD